jgi:glycerol-3-phosphate cytidylyltransferase
MEILGGYNMKKYKVGYTAGVYDMFHKGHLNILKKAKDMCEFLIVAINSDELVYNYKSKYPMVTLEDRMDIVSVIKYVDKVVPNYNLDKIDAWNQYEFNVVFIGDDWKGSERWNQTEKELGKIGVSVEYVPYTVNISSKKIREKLLDSEIGGNYSV